MLAMSGKMIVIRVQNLNNYSDLQEEPEGQERLSTMAVQLVSLVEVMDKVAADQEAMDDAAQQFNDLLQVSASVRTRSKLAQMHLLLRHLL